MLMDFSFYVFIHRLKTGRIMWLGMAGGGRESTHGSLPNLATWFPCGRGRTLFILVSL